MIARNYHVIYSVRHLDVPFLETVASLAAASTNRYGQAALSSVRQEPAVEIWRKTIVSVFISA